MTTEPKRSKHVIADEYAVQKCRELYPEDNKLMRAVAACIAMDAITWYNKKLRELRGKK